MVVENYYIIKLLSYIFTKLYYYSVPTIEVNVQMDKFHPIEYIYIYIYIYIYMYVYIYIYKIICAKEFVSLFLMAYQTSINAKMGN